MIFGLDIKFITNLIQTSKNKGNTMKVKAMRSRDKNGRIRQLRNDAQIGNVAPDIKKHFGYRSDKTVGAVLKENDVTSISELRRKIKD